MILLLILVLSVLSFVIALALGWGSLGASIIYLLLVTLVTFATTGKQKKDASELPDLHDERLTD